MDYETTIEQAKQRAKRFSQQSQFEAPQAQMVGGRYVSPHALQYLAAALRSGGGMIGEQMANQEIANLEAKRKQAVADALRNFGQQARGTPENAPGDGMGPVLPAQPADMMGAYQGLLTAPDPRLQEMALQGMARIPETQAAREAKAEEMRMRAEQRVEELKLQHQNRMDQLAANNASREQMAEQQRAFQREMLGLRNQFAQSMASSRPEKMATVVDPATGSPVLMPQSEAAGMIPYNPKTAGAIAKQNEQAKAKEQLDVTVGELQSYYNDLKSGGGIVSQGQGPLSNIGARLSSSSLGQAAGGAVGTKNQELRQKIEQTRPLLLNLIKNATGMSAQQMNSNAEMMLYLRAATDPTLSYEANTQALSNLQRLFGNKPAEAPAANSGKPKPRIRFDAQGNPIP